jgi:aminoglycoside phosphotransferase (APT) family kinase protein
VQRVERLGRWRPAWHVDALRDGVALPLYIRGARVDEIAQPQPLAFEAKVFRLFEQSGVRVPHIHGYIDELPAIVMDRVPGAPDVSRLESLIAREEVLSQFVDQMVLIHRVDPRLMEKAGAPRPAGSESLALAYLRRIERMYERSKRRPEPAIEYLRGWLNRSVPETPDVAYPIVVDSGQFIFEGNRLTAMLDFEFSALGDFHVDLAALRLRDRIESIGDLDQLNRLYAERSGLTVDQHRIRYHTVVKGLLPPLHMAGVLGAPAEAADYVQYLSWNAAWLRVAFESIAEINRWAIEPFEAPSAKPASRYDVTSSLLETEIREDEGADKLGEYERRRRLRLIKFLRRAQIYEADLEARYLNDVAVLLAHRPVDWATADSELENMILKDDGSRDEALVRLFLRQLRGQCFLLADPEEPSDYAALTTPLKPLRD